MGREAEQWTVQPRTRRTERKIIESRLTRPPKSHPAGHYVEELAPRKGGSSSGATMTHWVNSVKKYPGGKIDPGGRFGRGFLHSTASTPHGASPEHSRTTHTRARTVLQYKTDVKINNPSGISKHDLQFRASCMEIAAHPHISATHLCSALSRLHMRMLHAFEWRAAPRGALNSPRTGGSSGLARGGRTRRACC